MKARLCTVLLYAAYIIELITALIDKSELHNTYESYIFRLTFAMTLAVVLLSDHTKRGWLLILCGCVLGIISYRMTGRNEFLRMFIFAAACAGQSKGRMLKTAFYVTTAGCLLIVLLSAFGIFGARALTAVFRVSDGIATRYCFGFGHPNALHAMFCMLVLLGLVIYDERVRWWHLVLLLAADLGVYLLTDSRTGVALTAAGILMAGLSKTVRKQNWFYAAGAALIAACIAFSVWAAACSELIGYPPRGRLIRFLNGILSDRIAELYWVLPSERADITAWTLFSSPAAQRYFDMGWCRLFYWYGIVPALVVLGVMYAAVWRCSKKRDASLLVYLVSVSVYTVVEAHLVSVYIGRNYLLPILGILFAEWCREKETKMVGLSSLTGGKKR